MSAPYAQFVVYGTPVPQGSLRSGGRGRLYYSNAVALKPQRAAITAAAIRALPEDHTPLAGPIRVDVIFVMPRPKSVSASKRPDPIKPPDLDKMQRLVGDSLTTSELFVDDGQIIEWNAKKIYETLDMSPATHVRVWAIRS